MKTLAVVVVIGALSIIKKHTENHLKQIPGVETLLKCKNRTYKHCSYPQKKLIYVIKIKQCATEAMLNVYVLKKID